MDQSNKNKNKQNVECVGSGFSSWFNTAVESCRSSDYFCFFSDLGSKVMRRDQSWGEGGRDLGKRYEIAILESKIVYRAGKRG